MAKSRILKQAFGNYSNDHLSKPLICTPFNKSTTLCFKPLQPSDHDRLKPFFENQPFELCAYSLSSILAWQSEQYAPWGATDGERLIIFVEDNKNEENRHMILPVSSVRSTTPSELAGLLESTGHQHVWFVPQAWLNEHQNTLEDRFRVSAHQEYDDYLYEKDDLANLRGNKYAKKRNLINQFKREYISKNRVEVRALTPEDALGVIDFFDEWCREKSCDLLPGSDLSCEQLAAENAVSNISRLGLAGLMVKVDGKISGVGIGGPLTKDVGALHFEKAFVKIKGLYQFLDRECARHLFQGFRWINKESDMGDDGLAKAKKSYHPARMVNSYKLELIK